MQSYRFLKLFIGTPSIKMSLKYKLTLTGIRHN
jgi:hypothetical protein